MKPTMASGVLALILVMSTGTVFSAGYEKEKSVSDSILEAEQKYVQDTYTELGGKTLWFEPNPKAILATKFYSTFPGPDQHWERQKSFRPSSTTSFKLTKIHTLTSKHGTRKYFLEVVFEDGAIGYVPSGALRGNPFEMYEGTRRDFNEYVYTSPPDEVRQKEAQAKAAAERKEIAAAKQWAARGGVRVGMTKTEVMKSSWGRPTHGNKTTTAAGTREQWVYGGRNYLYFTNDVLTAIQN